MNYLHEVIILLAAGVVAVSLFKKLGLGSVLGYLAAGVVVGPYGLRLITDVNSIMHISEFGVVLLLFLIGLELEPSRLWVLRRDVFGLGGVQMALSTLVLTLFARLFDLPWGTSVVVAFALSLSSSAFVLQILNERRETLQPYGRMAFGILLFQDVAVIPFLATLPLFTGDVPLVLDGTTGQAIAKVIGAFIVVGLAGVFLVRPIFRFIARLNSQEIFTAATLLTVSGTALFMETVGLSMPLGAFLAGMLLANSEYRHEIEADIQPFQGLLLGLFFIAVGMNANLNILFTKPVALLSVTLVVMVLKTLVLAVIGRLNGQGKESTLRLALALPQGGEFSFVLFGVAVGRTLLPRDLADFLIMVVTLSMALTPFCFALADRLAKRFTAPHSEISYDRISEQPNPVIIAGFGRYGQIVGRMLRMRHIRFTALEASQAHVDFVRKFGNKIYYGDASRLDMLNAASAHQAKVFVLAIDDVETSIRTAALVRKHFPDLKIIARARNRNHVYRLLNLGVTVVHRQLFAGSLEGAASVLEALGDSREQARAAAERFRKHDEEFLTAGFAVQNDEQELIATAKYYAKELETLFERDFSNTNTSTS